MIHCAAFENENDEFFSWDEHVEYMKIFGNFWARILLGGFCYIM